MNLNLLFYLINDFHSYIVKISILLKKKFDFLNDF